jgi:hypothetical protein
MIYTLFLIYDNQMTRYEQREISTHHMCVNLTCMRRCVSCMISGKAVYHTRTRGAGYGFALSQNCDNHAFYA